LFSISGQDGNHAGGAFIFPLLFDFFSNFFIYIKILSKKPLTRNDLASQLNIPRSTIYDNLRKLQKKI